MSGKRGAPKGNKNACKHGFYSRAYTKIESREFSRVILDYRQDNIKFFKVIIARTTERIKPSASNPLTFQETLNALHAVVLAINRLHSAINLKFLLSLSKEHQDEESLFDSLKTFDMSEEETGGKSNEIVPIRKVDSKHGGQPRNDNAVKHGFFATQYLPEELGLLEDLDLDDLSDEMNLLLVLMKRVFIGMQDDLPLADFLRSVRTLAIADACLARLRRVTTRMQGASVIMAKVYKELSKLAFDED